MKNSILVLSLCVFTLWSCSENSEQSEVVNESDTTQVETAPNEAETPGRVVFIEAFDSEFIQARDVSIWLPDSYDEDTSKRYSVLYMHDGQNLFDPKYAYGGESWQADLTMDQLMKDGQVQESIIVGMWNTPARFDEYAPYKPWKNFSEDTKNKLSKMGSQEPVSDNYLKFIVEEMKAYMDKNYRTLPDREHTFIMGSSMGGLISIYALCEYPDVFGGAGCVSTHWPFTMDNSTLNDFTMKDYLAENLPQGQGHKIYFDYGTSTLDSLYEDYQKQIDEVMQEAGYDAEHWITRKFEGAEHNEKYWQERLDIPLTFLMAK